MLYDINRTEEDYMKNYIYLGIITLLGTTYHSLATAANEIHLPQNTTDIAVASNHSATDLLKASSQPTRVNAVHLSPFTEELSSTAITIDINQTEIINGIQYLQTSGYLNLSEDNTAPGLTVFELFVPAGSETAVNRLDVDLLANTEYSLMAIGDGFNQPISLMHMVDDNSPPTAGHAKVRVVHAAPFAASLMDTAVSVRTDMGELVNGLTAVEFGQNSEYFELPVGTYDLNIATPDGSTRLIDLAPLLLNEGEVITLYAVGEGMNQPLAALAVYQNGTIANLPLETPFDQLNAALSGAWHNPSTSGQGIMVEVFPQLQRIHGAWFTFDTTFADSG